MQHIHQETFVMEVMIFIYFVNFLLIICRCYWFLALFTLFCLILVAMFQSYSIITSDAHVILHNTVSVHCTVPSHLTDWVRIISWVVEEKHMDMIELSYSNIFGSLLVLSCIKTSKYLLGVHSKFDDFT